MKNRMGGFQNGRKLYFFPAKSRKTLEQYKRIYARILNCDSKIVPLEDDVFRCNNMHFYELSSEWCVGDNMEGNTYSEEHLSELAGKNEIIYIYFDEALLEGELIVIREGKTVRKLYDYYSVPE